MSQKTVALCWLAMYQVSWLDHKTQKLNGKCILFPEGRCKRKGCTWLIRSKVRFGRTFESVMIMSLAGIFWIPRSGASTALRLRLRPVACRVQILRTKFRTLESARFFRLFSRVARGFSSGRTVRSRWGFLKNLSRRSRRTRTKTIKRRHFLKN